MDHNHICNHTNCTSSISNQSLSQTLSEMDWERGIWHAAFYGDEDRVQYLISKAKKSSEAVNAPDNQGYTALHYAARNGHSNICQMLLINGANVNASTRSGNATPLHKAAAAGKLGVINLLIKNGATIDIQDIDGQTALHKAIENKRYDLVSVLLNACPELRYIQDKKGNCPDIPT